MNTIYCTYEMTCLVYPLRSRVLMVKKTFWNSLNQHLNYCFLAYALLLCKTVALLKYRTSWMKMCIQGWLLVCFALFWDIIAFHINCTDFPNISEKDKLFYFIYNLTANLVALSGAVILSSDEVARNRKCVIVYAKRCIMETKENS